MQPGVLKQFKGKENQVLSLALQKITGKIQYNDQKKYLYSFPSSRFAALLMERIMYQSNNSEVLTRHKNKQGYNDIITKNDIDRMSVKMFYEIVSTAEKSIKIK